MADQMSGTASCTPAREATELFMLARDYERADVVPALLRVLAEGRPVEPDRLAAALGIDADGLDDVFDGLPAAQWDDDGNLVGFGITLRPTPHHFVVDGRELYTWCAFDTLLFTVVLGRPTSVASTCPATGDPIRVRLDPDRVADFSPPGLVVSSDMPCSRVPDIRTAGCVHGHFFASADAAAPWRAEHPSGTLRPVVDEFADALRAATALGWAGSRHAG